MLGLAVHRTGPNAKGSTMATNTKGAKGATKGAKGAAPVAVQAPVAVPATVAVQAPVAVPATVQAVPAVHAGIAWEQLTKSQQAIATAKGGVHIAPRLAGQGLVLGPVPYKVRSGNNAFWWAQCMQAMQQGQGVATAQAMVQAGACPKFVGYAVARKWLASVPV